mmetsp:Transcript_2227/g.3284  ORF Transcript_2227/g.3284 Transcript_2227/m.3284 type:complete len:200 (+) Transcript_2227:1118-1717(+)
MTNSVSDSAVSTEVKVREAIASNCFDVAESSQILEDPAPSATSIQAMTELSQGPFSISTSLKLEPAPKCDKIVEATTCGIPNLSEMCVSLSIDTESSPTSHVFDQSSLRRKGNPHSLRPSVGIIVFPSRQPPKLIATSTALTTQPLHDLVPLASFSFNGPTTSSLESTCSKHFNIDRPIPAQYFTSSSVDAATRIISHK